MADEEAKGIRIGDDEWIPFMDENDDPALDTEIDPFLEDTRDLWSSLESNCGAGCCGIEAFDFRPKRLETIRRRIDVPRTLDKLRVLRARIASAPGVVASTDHLNFHAVKSTWLQLIDHLVRNFEG